MNKLRDIANRRPIAASIGIMLASMVLSQFIGIIISLIVPYDGSYFLNMVIEFFVVGIALAAAAIFSCTDMLYRFRKNFFRALIPATYLLASYSISLIDEIKSSAGETLRHPIQIIVFILTMILIGCAEEFLFRGVITNLILKKYGTDRAGIWYTAIISGIIFGFAHIFNALSGIRFSAVLIQIVMACMIGMVYAAIYIRTRNIWEMVFLHALNNFVALFSTGFFHQGSLASQVSSYSPVMYGALITFSIILGVLLRKSKVDELFINGNSESTEYSARRLYKAICAVSLAIIACIAYGVIDMFA